MSNTTETKINYFVDQIIKKLLDNREMITQQWKRTVGTKTRHFIVDDLLMQSDVNRIYDAFPKNGKGFFDKKSFRKKKKTSMDLSQYNRILFDITYAIQDHRVVNLISEVCDIKMIEPDPKLYAGGLSMMFKDDFLNPHIDNSHDLERKKFRRLNLLYYVSPNWVLENGGNFELWNESRTQPHTIISKQNRLVVMETNKSSWHSVSKVLTNQPRCCVSNYYFSKESPDGDKYFHVTSFMGRPEQPLRKFFGSLDNYLRNFVSKTFKIGRGKDQIYKDKK